VAAERRRRQRLGEQRVPAANDKPLSTESSALAGGSTSWQAMQSTSVNHRAD